MGSTRQEVVSYLEKLWRRHEENFLFPYLTGDYDTVLKNHTESYLKQKKNILDNIERCKVEYGTEYGRHAPYGLKGVFHYEIDLKELEDRHERVVKDLTEKINSKKEN